MPSLTRHPIARFVVLTAFSGALADWVLFATMVVTVDALLGSTPWATALVLIARIVPGVLFAPLAARRIDRGDLRRSLVGHETLRVLAVAIIAGGFAAGSIPVVLGGLLALEFGAAMQAAGRESVISRHVPRSVFTRINTATAVISYGLLPVGAALVAWAGTTAGWVLTLSAYAVVAVAYLGLRLPAPQAPVATVVVATKSDSSGRPAWLKIVAAAALGLLPAVALFSVGPDLAEAWLGQRTATGVLYGLVLAGAAVGVVAANLRHVPATLAMATAAGGLTVTLVGMWPVGLVLLGAGAGAAYLELQTRLQHAAANPSEFAAAFATLKVASGTAVVAAPWLVGSGGIRRLLAAGIAVTLAGAAIAAPAPGRLVQLAIRELLGVALGILVRIDVTNPDVRHVGPAVVVSNHPHWLDGAVAVKTDRSMRPVARWQAHRGARLGIWAGNCVVTTAGTGRDPRPAYTAAADHLRGGGRIWLAPEGGAHARPALRHPRSGAVRMAAAAGVVIQPLAIRWVDDYAGPDLSRWRPWRRPRVEVTWGPVVEPIGQVEVDNRQMMSALADAADLPIAMAEPTVAA